MTTSIYTKDYRYITEKLLEARKKANLKQIEVAKKLGKPQSYVSKVEKGERRIDVVELKILAKIYNKDITFFIN
jgi:transcriptional regulator with XRE-family HTH domain